MGRLFGTDGVRGKAGSPPLDPPTVRRLGAALVRALRHGGDPVRFLAGRDTRESGAWIERELAFGVRAEGASLTSAGIIPTPAIAYLTPRMGYTAGVVISASHNPFEDNGIKVFSGAGEKFTEALERHGRGDHGSTTSWRVPPRRRAGRADRLPLRVRSPTCGDPAADARSRRGMRIAVDCANGATTTIAPRLFQELGFDARCIGVRARRPQHQPALRLDAARGARADGRRRRLSISASPSTATATARSSSTRPGTIVDGDAVMLMCAKQMKAEGRLKGNAIVATVMSNIGLEIALRDAGIGIVRCPVGDKYVMEEMLGATSRSAASSRATSSSPTICSPATAWPRR